jgi:hypothetical protein
LNSVIKNFEFTDLEIAINQSFGYYKWLIVDLFVKLIDNK